MARPPRFVFPNPPPVLGDPQFGNNAQGYLGAFPALRDYIEATADWYETDFAKSLPNGTAALPSLAFTSQPNTGIYRPAASVLAISINGTERARFTTGGMQVSGSEVFRRANVLGTVSQSSGVPTGAIIQRGSNANGEFVRFADGTQICTSPNFTADCNIPLGSIFRSTDSTWTYPAAFSSVPHGAANTVNTVVPFAHVRMANNTAEVRLGCGQSRTGDTIRAIAIGRWF